MGKKIIQQIEAEILDYSELSKQESAVVHAAKEALKNAYAPYSHFHVGSAVLLANGEIVQGSNQENAAYPSGLCAERVALFSAGSNYPGVKIEMIGIAAMPAGATDHTLVSSCGNCRQVMMEYQSRQDAPMHLLFVHPNREVLRTTVRDVLPFGFDSKSLEK